MLVSATRKYILNIRMGAIVPGGTPTAVFGFGRVSVVSGHPCPETLIIGGFCIGTRVSRYNKLLQELFLFPLNRRIQFPALIIEQVISRGDVFI